MSQAPRDISKILQKFRQALFSGRPFQYNLRHEDLSLAKRTQPQPNIPGGVSHELRNNYYFSRDSRRSSMPAEVIYVNKTLVSPEKLDQLKSK